MQVNAEHVQAGKPTVEVAIATTLNRLQSININNYPSGNGYNYVIYVQNGDRELVGHIRNQFSERPDVSLVPTDGIGAARNRNCAIRMCKQDILLFTDDDVVIDPGGLKQLVAAFKAHPQASLIAGMARNQYGIARKRYHAKVQRMSQLNCAKIGTIELAVRPKNIRDANILFDEQFGAGTSTPIGDEYIFATDAIKAGLVGLHMPIFLATHFDESSGEHWSAETGRHRSKVFDRVFGARAILYKIGFLLKNVSRIEHGQRLKFTRTFLSGA